jgi:hypothetical protein
MEIPFKLNHSQAKNHDGEICPLTTPTHIICRIGG